MDPKPGSSQAAAQHVGEVVVLEPKDWTSAEEALSKLAHTALNRRRPPAGSDFSAGPRVTEPSPDPTLRPADLRNDRLTSDRLARGTSRSPARLLAAACFGVAVTLAWQSYGGPARQMIASAVPQLGWLAPAMDPPSSRDSVVEQANPPLVQAPVPQDASAQGGAGAPTASETAVLPAAPAALSPEVQQQLETMARDLAAVRQSVEQLGAGQEQMARDIAKLHAPAPDPRRRVSAFPPPAVPATAARKPVLPPPEPAPQSSTATLPPPPLEPPPQASTAPLPPAPEPPRPPMPVR